MSSRNSFNLFFYINRSKQKRNGECPVMLRITINGRSVAVSLKRSINAEIWEPAAGLAKGKSNEAMTMNKYIDAVRVRAYEKHNELLTTRDELSPELLRDAILNINSAKGKMLVEVWEEHNIELKELIGKETSYANFQKYNTCLKYMKEFLLRQNKCEDIQVKLIDRHLVSRFEHFLKVEKGCNYNTAIKYMQNFKKITKRAQHNGWLMHDPFSAIKLSLKEVERPYLNEQELQDLMSKEFSIERLAQVRDIFVFSCFTGLSYIDVHKLKRNELERGNNGKLWIKTKRQKTGVRANIPLLDVAQQIIEKYADRRGSHDESVLPVISNQKMNAYLKEIATICGIHKCLSFHIARHTFATTVTLMNGVPIETVSKMLGHKNLRSTQHYARVVDQKVGEDMELLALRLESKLALVG
jgi:site-specific recombinase XerD